MDSGSILISAIVIDRPNRIRRNVTEDNILALADSISRRGLLHPVTLERHTNILIAGETRILAHQHLGLDRIEYRYLDQLSEREKLAIELEENVKRSDLTWQDQCDAVLKFHRLQKEEIPTWTYADTAKEIGFAENTIKTKIAVAEKIESGDKRITGVKDYSVARNLVTRINLRDKADELAIITTPAVTPASPIITTNFEEWVQTYDGPSFNLIHCDFPYGVGVDKMDGGASELFGGYKDDFATYSRLCDTLGDSLPKLAGESAHLIFWFAMKHYDWTLARLKAMGLWVDFQPLIWFKSDNTGALPDPERGPRRVYETAFWCSWGDRKILSAKANCFPAPVTRLGEHMSEKSQPMLEHFMRMVVDGNTRLLDPTCGSGASLRAADALGAASVTGLELDRTFADNARRAWEKRNG